ncbi:MAG: hypothetical protein AAGB29_12265 [Planctomycetota bacterium]
MAKRNSIPPYEIMGRRPAEPGGEGEPEAGPAPVQSSAEAGEPGRMVGGLSEPVVLRVPRGLAVVAIVGVLGLIVIGYAVGQRRGYSAGEAAARAQAQEEVNEIRRMTGRPAIPGGTVDVDAATSDPRRRGLRYYVVSHEPPAEAERLIAFLDRFGVDAAAVASDNPRFVKVIAAQGFSSGELRSATGRDYEQALRRIGRAWQDANDGGKDLSDLYAELYEG